MGALALCLLAAGCAGGGDDASPTRSGGATVSPGASSTPVDVPPVFTLHKDFFPVPQADAADIPWDEVGPGWFLVDAHQYVELDLDSASEVRAPEALGGLSLVSPDGEWFAARAFAGTGAAFSVHWSADGAWLMKNVDVNSEARGGDIVSVNLATGATADVAANEWGYYSYASAAGGVVVGGGDADIQDGYHLHNSIGAADPSCTQPAGIGYGDLRTVLAPDGQRVVCWGERQTDQKTDVGYLDLRTPSVATYVDVFRLEFWRYESLGWLSDDAFLLARLDDDHKQEAYFSYDLSTQRITDFALPFTRSGAQRVEAFDYSSQVFFTSDTASDSIGMYRANGDPIVNVAAGCSDGYSVPSWALSGGMVLVSCGWWEGGDATLVNLATGNVVGSWAYSPGLEVLAYGYPGHAD
jgi:hypothetical protein